MKIHCFIWFKVISSMKINRNDMNYFELFFEMYLFVSLIHKLFLDSFFLFYLFILLFDWFNLIVCFVCMIGDKFITGSYDRTCKVWNTLTGDELLTLEGHRNVVYAIAFNNPYGDKIITGSFGMYCIYPSIRVSIVFDRFVA